jgi:hypothetical protein
MRPEISRSFARPAGLHPAGGRGVSGIPARAGQDPAASAGAWPRPVSAPCGPHHRQHDLGCRRVVQVGQTVPEVPNFPGEIVGQLFASFPVPLIYRCHASNCNTLLTKDPGRVCVSAGQRLAPPRRRARLGPRPSERMRPGSGPPSVPGHHPVEECPGASRPGGLGAAESCAGCQRRLTETTRRRSLLLARYIGQPIDSLAESRHLPVNFRQNLVYLPVYLRPVFTLPASRRQSLATSRRCSRTAWTWSCRSRAHPARPPRHRVAPWWEMRQP